MSGWHSRRFRSGQWGDLDETLAVEEPLEIEVEGRPYAVLMRTPGDEVALAAGFSLAEGLIDSVQDLGSIGHCKEMTRARVSVRLTETRRERVADLLQRRGFLSRSSCGICGKEIIEDIVQRLRPIERAGTIAAERLLALQHDMLEAQELFRQTGCTHAGALFDESGGMISLGEDVGRHNALDKAVGKALLGGQLGATFLAIVSSRASFEMVQKAARAGLPVMASVSAATQMAVQLAHRAGLTLVGFLRENGFTIYSHGSRIEK